ncbi:NUDIX hydrolase [Pseudobacter ginsenosidimutans]|jgi:8-oxo-dGTP diphosphatase|uniref:8-oxo-dGTP diphosphatase n=1 Tax=Pseudobacter ginsenosidimutans TaxID=661488 RepID=A0A4Q7MSN6_9BACT|nr:NUDIX domain-containing protein [Pseudobacter ginsenosidimutans]QEC41718.1 NUDIX hydrolase [Pseudobacter ginsenosidimutans]RZS71478.1 8-oxo-dGTP diphosphatase [Pseudobacter ginsenosidimutans]
MTRSGSDIKVAVDAIVFGYSKQEGVSILLIQRKYPPFKNAWAIPGGFLLPDETLEDAVRRELREETGIEVNYLEQLYTFGAPNRDPRQRIISIAYMALVKSSLFQQLKASTDAENAQWFNFRELPPLAFDHKAILDTAIERIRTKIRYQPIGFELLDKKFPFADLEKLYIALLGRDIDRRNFSKKMLALGILDETNEYAKPEGKGRPSKMYQFNKKRYQQLEREGIHFEI